MMGLYPGLAHATLRACVTRQLHDPSHDWSGARVRVRIRVRLGLGLTLKLVSGTTYGNTSLTMHSSSGGSVMTATSGLPGPGKGMIQL